MLQERTPARGKSQAKSSKHLMQGLPLLLVICGSGVCLSSPSIATERQAPQSIFEALGQSKQQSEPVFTKKKRARRAGDLPTESSARDFFYWKNEAEAGDSEAQLILGRMYDDGTGVVQDQVEARKWYLQAALQELAEAQYNLGVMYQFGYGGPEDHPEAFKWYRKAAERGLMEAQFYVGVLYDHGIGVRTNNAEAVKYYRLAALQGYAPSEYYLGTMYDEGEGVAKDEKEAVKWYKKAAEGGYADAQLDLYAMYALGEGVPQDLVEALAWMIVGLSSLPPDPQMTSERSMLETKMTPEQRRLAEERAKRYLSEFGSYTLEE